LGGRGRRISEFEASLVYKVSSRTARVSKPCLEPPPPPPKKKRLGLEIAQQLRALTAILEVMSSIPSNHMVVMGSDALFWCV